MQTNRYLLQQTIHHVCVHSYRQIAVRTNSHTHTRYQMISISNFKLKSIRNCFAHTQNKFQSFCFQPSPSHPFIHFIFVCLLHSMWQFKCLGIFLIIVSFRAIISCEDRSIRVSLCLCFTLSLCVYVCLSTSACLCVCVCECIYAYKTFLFCLFDLWVSLYSHLFLFLST